MPARVGIESDRLLPPAPWQALQVKTLENPGASTGPAAAALETPVARRASRTRAKPAPVRSPYRVLIAASCSRQDVVPDAAGPADRVLTARLALRGRELLLDLDDLAVLDLVGVDHR